MNQFLKPISLLTICLFTTASVSQEPEPEAPVQTSTSTPMTTHEMLAIAAMALGGTYALVKGSQDRVSHGRRCKHNKPQPPVLRSAPSRVAQPLQPKQEQKSATGTYERSVPFSGGKSALAEPRVMQQPPQEDIKADELKRDINARLAHMRLPPEEIKMGEIIDENHPKYKGKLSSAKGQYTKGFNKMGTYTILSFGEHTDANGTPLLEVKIGRQKQVMDYEAFADLLPRGFEVEDVDGFHAVSGYRHERQVELQDARAESNPNGS